MTAELNPVARRFAPPFRIAVRNQVRFVLLAIGATAVALSGFVGVAPNRLVSGSPLPLWAAASALDTGGLAALGAVLLGASIAKASSAIVVPKLYLKCGLRTLSSRNT